MRHTNSVRLLFGMPILYTLSVWLSPERWAYARKHFGVTELKWIIISHWASSSYTCNGVYLNFSLPVQHYILQAFIRPPTTGFRVVRVATRQPTQRHPRNSGTTNLVNFRLPKIVYFRLMPHYYHISAVLMAVRRLETPTFCACEWDEM